MASLKSVEVLPQAPAVDGRTLFAGIFSGAFGLTRCFGGDSVDYHELSFEELKEHLARMDEDRAGLAKVLLKRQHEARSDLVRKIRDMIDDYGYDHEEIAAMLVSKRRRGSLVAREIEEGGRGYLKYIDPENPNRCYVRGVLPGWMKQKMLEQGLDPTIKDDRENFKTNYLKAVAA